ncbi:MAG: sulfur carrier protein ThiS adenylyltransferase ThiF [Bacillota bacterium]
MSIRIWVNERELEFPDGSDTDAVRQAVKPDADLVIFNGFPAGQPQPLQSGDRVVLIRKGELPPADEMEALMVSRHTPGVHERVKRACVGIAGLGGLGSAIAVALARVGVGRLILVDFDLVEPSNLNRQQYFVDQIGLYKVDALAANLARINPYTRLTPYRLRLDASNIQATFAGADVVVEAFDSAEAKAMLVSTVLSQIPGVPVVAGSGMAGYGSSNTIRTHRARANLYVCGDLSTGARPGAGLMAPRVGICAHHQANAVLRLLLGEDPTQAD